MPGAVQMPVSYRQEARHWTRSPLGWLQHVVVGNGSPFRTFEDAKSPPGAASPTWGSTRGRIGAVANHGPAVLGAGCRQPAVLRRRVRGLPQRAAHLRADHRTASIHTFLEEVDVAAKAPGQAGIGTHYMGGAAWGGHSCPDPERMEGRGPRSNQRGDIIRAAGRPPRPATPIPATLAAPAPAGTNRRRTARLQQLLDLVADGLWGPRPTGWL